MDKSNGHTSSVDRYFQAPEPAETPTTSAPISPPRTINLRFQTGEEKAFPYSQLIWLDYNPSKGILMHFASHTVAMWGKNLRPLYIRLVTYDLPEIIEESEQHDVDESERPIVDKIREWTKPEPTGNPWARLPVDRK